MDHPDTGLHLDWEQACAVLAALDPWCSPAELQGLFCGAVCADGSGPSDDGWLDLIHAHSGQDLGAGADVTPLLEFRQRVLAGLADDTLAFPLLLPGDDASLSARLEALGLWCGGFLSGFGLAGGSTDGLDEDAVSALEDMVAIAEVDPETEDGEAAEGQYLEISEYVRMAVLMLLAGVQARAVDALESRDPEAPEH
ncbi:MAG: UPF0149 family protein [Pseudomonadales bacterium]|jgi:uncharacterized protein YgfB (UPF0149 family)|nr:UPF0149 family protein [Pseudomonadales bacterium]